MNDAERSWWRFVVKRKNAEGAPMFMTPDGLVDYEDRMEYRFCGPHEAARDELERRFKGSCSRGESSRMFDCVVLDRVEGEAASPATHEEVLREVRRILRTPDGADIVGHALSVRRLADLGAVVIPLVESFRAEVGS
jgi:hypothetical protein